MRKSASSRLVNTSDTENGVTRREGAVAEEEYALGGT